MFKLDLEKAEEPQIKLPISVGSSKEQESSRKNLLLPYWLRHSLWLCGSQQTVENSSRDGNTRPPDLPPRNLYAGQETTVRTGHGTTDWFKIGKLVHQGFMLSPCLFNLCAEYITRNTVLDDEIKIAGRNIHNLRYADDTTLMAERRTKEPLDESARGKWKSWLKAQHSEN